MINRLLQNVDKIRKGIKRASDYGHFFSPYIRTIHRHLSPHLSEKANRITNKGLDVTDKLIDIGHLITA